MSNVDTNNLSELRIVRDSNAYAAVGRAAGMLMIYESFGQLPFGQIMKIIAGQINRGHYRFVLRGNEPVGFFGWAYASKIGALKWLEENDESHVGDGVNGDYVIMNIWHARETSINAFAQRELLKVFEGKKTLYAKRRYADGRIRPVRVNIPPPKPENRKFPHFEASRGDSAHAENTQINVAN